MRVRCSTWIWACLVSACGSPTDSGAEAGIDGQVSPDANIADVMIYLDSNVSLDAEVRLDSRPDAKVERAPLGAVCDVAENCEIGAECARGRCVEPGYAYVPNGEFTMGAPPTELGFHEDRENGQHTVIITRPMLVKKTEVTQGEWSALMDRNPSYHGCGEDCPVEMINWWEMLHYANALSVSRGLEQCYELVACKGTLGGGCPEGIGNCNGYECSRETLDFDLDCTGYRLPTEAEWEYFARAGSTTAYITATGEHEPNYPGKGLDVELDKIAWYGGNSGVTYAPAWPCADLYPGAPEFCGTHPVAQKEPNAWGLFDITGNVWERVWDESGDYPEPGTTVTDPKGPAVDYPANIQRRMRGGPYNAWGQYMRVAYRTGPKDYKMLYNSGFRLVRSLSVPEASP